MIGKKGNFELFMEQNKDSNFFFVAMSVRQREQKSIVIRSKREIRRSEGRFLTRNHILLCSTAAKSWKNIVL